MEFNIYIDESGTSDLKDHLQSPCFTLIGIVINKDSQEKLKTDFNELKRKYFGKKGFVIHGVNIRRDLKRNGKKLENFADDFQKLANKHSFFILSTSVDKEKAKKWSWMKGTVLKRSYRSILRNLVIFLIGKDAKGGIVAEASSTEKDIEIYKSFFHFIAHGISKLQITPTNVKEHLTSVSFVTKNNNDPEEQIADLFGICGKIEHQLRKKEIKPNNLDSLNKSLYEVWKKKLFHGKYARNKKKIKLYKSMESFKRLP